MVKTENIGANGRKFLVRPNKIIGIQESAMDHVTVYLVGMPNYKTVFKTQDDRQTYVARIEGICNA